MDMKSVKTLCVVLAAALVLIPSLLTSLAGITFSEIVNQVALTAAILLIMAYVLVDIKDVSKKKAAGKLAACAGLLYAIIMQWIG